MLLPLPQGWLGSFPTHVLLNPQHAALGCVKKISAAQAETNGDIITQPGIPARSRIVHPRWHTRRFSAEEHAFSRPLNVLPHHHDFPNLS